MPSWLYHKEVFLSVPVQKSAHPLAFRCVANNGSSAGPRINASYYARFS